MSVVLIGDVCGLIRIALLVVFDNIPNKLYAVFFIISIVSWLLSVATFVVE